MEINKQLFEDVFSGKLKGTFVLKNGKKFNDKLLTDIYNATAVFCKATYYFNGKPIVSDYNGILDIVDFIPDTNMKENYCLYTYECGSLKIFGRRTTRAKHKTITDAIMEYTKHVEHMTKVNKGKPAFVNKQILVVRYTDAYQSEIVGIIENGHYTCIKEGKM